LENVTADGIFLPIAQEEIHRSEVKIQEPLEQDFTALGIPSTAPQRRSGP